MLYQKPEVPYKEVHKRQPKCWGRLSFCTRTKQNVFILLFLLQCEKSPKADVTFQTISERSVVSHWGLTVHHIFIRWRYPVCCFTCWISALTFHENGLRTTRPLKFRRCCSSSSKMWLRIPSLTIMNHLIVYSNQVAPIEVCKLIVNELSKGCSWLGYWSKWLSAT